MEKYSNLVSAILVRAFDLVSKSGCSSLWGEPDFPEELKEEEN